jgi:hypothetical protein
MIALLATRRSSVDPRDQNRTSHWLREHSLCEQSWNSPPSFSSTASLDTLASHRLRSSAVLAKASLENLVPRIGPETKMSSTAATVRPYSCGFSGRGALRRRQAVAYANHKLCILAGDGIGPEIMAVATSMLEAAGKKTGDTFEMEEHLIGGAAIDKHDDPYPAVTEEACKRSDSVLLAAIGGYELHIGSK